jgi:hypothetical protein
LNYNDSSAKYNIEKAFENRMNNGRYETLLLLDLLSSIIDRDGNEGEALTRMYDMCCKGLDFLEDLGMYIGLDISNMFYDNDYNELNQDQKLEIVESAYPKARELAIEVRKWIIEESIKLTGNLILGNNRMEFLDLRKEEEKLSPIWIQDKRNGKNYVNNKSSWIKRFFGKQNLKS